MIFSIHHNFPIPSPPTGWTNRPIHEFPFSNLNWRQFLPCHNIHVYFSPLTHVNAINISRWLERCSRRRIQLWSHLCQVYYFNIVWQSPIWVKNDPCDVIKMREMRGSKWERKPLKKRWIIPHFYDVTWMILDTILTQFGLCNTPSL